MTWILALALMSTGTVDDLAFMAGRWVLEKDGQQIEETWTSAEGGLMVGMSRTLKDGRGVFYEFLLVQERGRSLVYVARPGGSAPVEFRMTALKNGLVVFENKDHDYPKRVMYRQEGDDGLLARVDDGTDEDPRAIELRYRRPE